LLKFLEQKKIAVKINCPAFVIRRYILFSLLYSIDVHLIFKVTFTINN